MSNTEWLIEFLDKEIAIFDDHPSPLLSYQIEAFDSYYDILQENGESLANRPKQRRSERQRVRDILTDIFVNMGPAPFILCTFAVPISKLSGTTHKAFFVQFRNWWKATSPPPGLTVVAEDICKVKSIKTLISSYRKRKYPEYQFIDEETKNVNVNKSCDDSTQVAVASSQPPPTIIEVTATELLSFLQENQQNSPQLQVVCPLFGWPLPSIDIKLDSSMERTVKIELSLRASEALIKHVRLSRDLSGVAEVSD